MCQDNCKGKDVMKQLQTDIIIIGSGIAALQCARILGKKFTIHLITKDSLYTSSSYRAQGGIAVVSSSTDTVQSHIDDTLSAGVHHHHEAHVHSLLQDGSTIMEQLLEHGLPVDRLADGTPALGLEGAHSHHRILHAGGDQTGKYVIDYLVTRLPDNVIIHEQEMAFELLLNTNGDCIGVSTMQNGTIKHYFGHHTILATGGAGALYEYTSNFQTSTGDGIALAWRAGAEISDMEFMQFHPSLLVVNNEGKGLVSEAVRGAGGIFVNERRKPIMQGVHPLLDLAPRHITAHTLFKKRSLGEQTFLDISSIEGFAEKFPTITQLCEDNGIQIKDGLLPVAPGSHFLMGGVIADTYGHTSVAHLYAIGEVACTGVHGANRLASNSLLEGITFGHQLAEHLLTIGCNQTNFILNQDSQYTSSPQLLQKSLLKKRVSEALGIIRSKEAMVQFKQQLPTFSELVNPPLKALSAQEVELTFMHIVARLMVEAALTRTESRGAHIREDYVDSDPMWTQQWIIFKHQQMKVRNSLYEQHQAREHA